MRVLLPADASRGDVEPPTGLSIGTAHEDPAPTTGSPATRFVKPARGALRPMVASDLRSELMT